jgi:hypothetical protein
MEKRRTDVMDLAETKLKNKGYKMKSKGNKIWRSGKEETRNEVAITVAKHLLK